jgi:hypothetical protein
VGGSNPQPPVASPLRAAPMIRRMNGVYLKGAEESKKAYYNKEWSSSDRASAQASFTQSSSDSCSSQ